MSWICPECKRVFKNRNQSHSCLQVDVNMHFQNKAPFVKEMYQAINDFALKLPGVSCSAVKNAILYSGPGTFLALKPKKEWLDIEFVLDQEHDEFPVYKTVRISKRRVAHFLRFDSPEDVDEQFRNWVKEAYMMMKM